MGKLFAIVFDLEGLDLRPLQYLLHYRLCYGRESGTGTLLIFQDMLVQIFNVQGSCTYPRFAGCWQAKSMIHAAAASVISTGRPERGLS